MFPIGLTVSGLFPLVSNLLHDDHHISVAETLSRWRGADMQVDFLTGYHLLLSDFIANVSISPGDRFTTDFALGFTCHSVLESLNLLRGTASLEFFEVPDSIAASGVA